MVVEGWGGRFRHWLGIAENLILEQSTHPICYNQKRQGI
jgi:hypothetical protein